MSVTPIRLLGDPVLHTPATPVVDFDAELRGLVADLTETMHAAGGAGLAAPQIGVGLRVFTYAFDNDDDVAPRGALVNPVLTVGKVSQDAPDPDEESEGCLSVPGHSWPLKRADWVRVAGFDVAGDPVAFEATGWFARVMQHEYDHLDGKLYVDRLDARQSRKARKSVKNHGWGVPGLTWMPGVDPDPFGH